MTFSLATKQVGRPRVGHRVIVQIISVEGAPPSVHDGRWLIAWNPHVDDTIGDVVSTDIKALATVFDINLAIETHRAVSVRRQQLPNGRPNRPLTAYNCVFVGV